MSTTLLRLTGSTLTFDVATLAFEDSCRITEHPVETGSNVSDHSQRLPGSITINGTISESPFDYQLGNLLAARRSTANAFLSAIAGDYPFPAEQITIINETYGTFYGYMLQTWSHVLDDVKRALFVCVFKKISQATATFVGMPAAVAGAAFGAATTAGEQATTATTAAGATGGSAASTADTSILANLIYGL